ncbi:MAG TPA: hypothetical protein DCX03_06605 [Bacteroidales bacterium]|nr:hypothetical protein [Bacteroidales bacterium]
MIKSKKAFIIVVVILFLPLLYSSGISAQIFIPDGVRIPGTWNNWNNVTNMGGPYDLQIINSGVLRWQTTFQYTGISGTHEFKFVSTAFGDPWGNQWAANTNVTLNAQNVFTYGAPSDPNNIINLHQNKWYTVVFKDNGYANTTAIFMETSAKPVNIISLNQTPLMVNDQDSVEIIIQLQNIPSIEEKFFLCYSNDEWATQNLVPFQMSNSTGVAFIPPFPYNTKVSYYAFSTVVSNPLPDPDLFTLLKDDNLGENYSYTVGETIQCGQAIDVVTTDPVFVMEGKPIVIYFNAELGNGGLLDYSGDVYAHTGVITNLSTLSSDWRYVKTEWGQNTAETKLTRISTNLYSLNIPDIRLYYGVPQDEDILKLAFVFRGGEPDANGNFPEHKNADGSDIFVEVYADELSVKILSPTRKTLLASPNEILPVCVEALQSDTLSIYLGNTLLTEDTALSIAYPLDLTGYTPGTYWIRAIAKNNSQASIDSVSIYLRGPVEIAELPEGVKNGINYLDDHTVTLVLNDPLAQKKFVFAIGDYSNWLPNDDNYMKKTPDGQYFWVTLKNLQPSKEYAFQYFIDGTLIIADPYCDKILDPWNDRWIPSTTYPNLKPYPFGLTTNVVSVLQTQQPSYEWEIPSFTPPAIDDTQQDLLIYEILLRDFTEDKNLNSAIEKLDYLKDLGVNAVELMPVAEFDGNESWGYAPNFFFAPDKFYGTRQNYKKFIDECHQRNIAVILDIVMNHAYGQCPLVQMYWDDDKPSANNPWFNQSSMHPYTIGYDFNHQSPYTRQFFKDVLSYWLTEYKVDGFRFDLSKGLTQTYTGNDVTAWSQYDKSRIDILSDYYNHIKSINPKAYVILEHFANNDEEIELANKGMLLWSGMIEPYKQVGIGWSENSDLSWAYHANRGFSYPNLVDYRENHDEERVVAAALQWGNSSPDYNLKNMLTAVKHQEMSTILHLGIPGPKMIWQFGELGYDYSIFYGGERTAPKPPHWDYLNVYERERLNRVTTAMAKLRKSDAFRLGSFNSDLAGKAKKIWISHPTMDITIAANMDVYDSDFAPGFSSSGVWYDYFTGEEVNISNPAGQKFHFGPGEYRLFTNQPLPRPFFTLNITVLEDSTQQPLPNVDITLTPWGERLTSESGNASFTVLPQQLNMRVSKQDYLPIDTTFTPSQDANLIFHLTRGPNALNELKDQNILIYPNPANKRICITNAQDYSLEIYNLQGKCLRKLILGTSFEILPIDEFPEGIYLLKFQKEATSYYSKLIIY